jgi:FKBP-type peptidyl-prolyl cis-trans isomerase
MNIGTNMKMQGIDSISAAALNKGIADAMKGNKPLMDENTANMTIQQKLQEFMMKKVNLQKEEGRKFLEENKKQPGVVSLPNGIQYKIINQGSGMKPVLEDTIKVHYKGTTIDGNVFDDSYSRGEPIEFPLGNLIEGWKQTLVLMPVGSKWQIFLPSDFGYGDRGAGANIPGGATLVFELELLDVKPKQVQQ